MLLFLTNAINVLLVALVAAAPFLTRRGTSIWEFWLRSAIGIAISVICAESGKKYEVWPGHPSFPSGHETLALSAGVCLAVRDRRWLWLTLPLGAVQAWGLIAGHFHEPVDVAGALISGVIPPLAAHLWKRPGTGTS